MLFSSLSSSRPSPPPESSSALALEAQADAALEAGDTRAAIDYYRAALEVSPLHRPLREKLGDALLLHAEHRASRSTSSRMIAPMPTVEDEFDEEEEEESFVAPPPRRKAAPARETSRQKLQKRLFPPPAVPGEDEAEEPAPTRQLRRVAPPPPTLARPVPPRRGPIVAPRGDMNAPRRRWNSLWFALFYAGILLIVAGVAHGVLVRVLVPVELPSVPQAPTLPTELVDRLSQAGLHLTAREPEKAIALLENASSVYPDHGEVITPALARALRVLGNQHLAQRDYAEAEKAFERAANLEADNPDNWIDLAKSRREHGRSLQAAQRNRGDGLLREAIAAYERAVKIQPELLAAHVGLGQTYSFLNERNKAVDHFRKVVAIAPGSPEARMAEEQLAQLVGRS